MNILRKILVAVSFSLAIFSCTDNREEIIEGGRDAKPVLRSVITSVTAIVLPEGESAEITFKVLDHDFVFNYSVSSPGCQVKVLLSGGREPEFFRLKDVRFDSGKDSYVAVIEDLGTGEHYDSEAFVAVFPEADGSVFFRSSTFTVKAEIDPAGTVKTGLPVVYVNTKGGVGIYSKTEYVPAEIMIKGTKTLPGLDAKACSIRGRGNTTWSWPKKPYLVKLDEKESIFGLPKHKRWVLLANFLDRTLMRNLVSMKVASFMTNMAWNPHCQPVELVLNGEHMGSYLLIEQVRVDNDRVNITEMTNADNSGNAVTGGYLLELDFHYDNEFQWKDHNIPFAVKYPDPQDLTSQQKSYIKNYIAEVANVIYGSSFADPVNGYAKYLDVNSFIDYWIVFEVMTNHELGNPGSVMFHKDRGGLLTAGPCWDFDWGVLSFYTSNGETGLVNKHAIWYDRLFKDDAFKAKVKARFNELLPQLETIPDYMEECRALLSESAKLNFAMWNPAEDASMNGGNIINGDENLSFDAAVDRLKSNYKKHLQVIQSKL